MSSVATAARPVASAGWINLGVAALAMVATLPGRTHGLGLVTEPLLQDVQISRVQYGAINLWATLLGALFCVPWGWLIDRLGARNMLALTLMSLGGVVVVMGDVQGNWLTTFSLPIPAWLDESGTWTITVAMDLFVLVLLTRGLGQSALSVVSLTLMGQSTGRRPGMAVGVYSFLTAIGFMASFMLIKHLDSVMPWRALWSGIGWVVLASGPISWLVARPLAEDGSAETALDAPGLTLRQALWTPAFWVFSLATSLYGLIAAGISLFNQAILHERGFDRDVFLTITAVMPLVGLASNLACGWLATRWSLGRLLAGSMILLGGALVCFPLVETLLQVYAYAAVMGIAGGMVTVIFFAVWRQVYGTRHLGQIQGAAQMLTVLASALGPLLVAECQARSGSYLPFLQGAAAVSALFAVAGWWVSVPVRVPQLETDAGRVPHTSSSATREAITDNKELIR